MDVSLSCLRNVTPPVTSHAPSIWAADAFSNYYLEEQVEKKYEEAIEELKQEAGGMLMAAATPIKQMVLIDTFERLGLAYHFETEIEQKLQKIYDDDVHGDDSNLFTTALRFRLLRQHQHRISSNVFEKYVGEDGKFKETLSSDAEGLLSLYEAAHVRFRDEEILEEAARFTRHPLSCMESQLESPLQEKVKRALECPLHREVPIFYIRFFISIYENDNSMDELLLKLAKFNFNFLQILYRKELCELFRWWNTFDLKSKLPYARDRLAEAYIWSASYHYEPQYSYVRKRLAKCVQINGIMDDTYDNYATQNEAQLLTEILDRKANQSLHSYVSKYYLTETLVKMYAGEVECILHPDEWDIPLEVRSRIVLAPINPRQAGRPRTSRVSSESSRRSRPKKCSRCGKVGHYSARCTEHISNEDIDTSQPSVSRPRRPRQCSICHVAGHTKTTCPQKGGES